MMTIEVGHEAGDTPVHSILFHNMSWHFERHAAAHHIKRAPCVLTSFVLIARRVVGSKHDEYIGNASQSSSVVIKRILLSALEPIW